MSRLVVGFALAALVTGCGGCSSVGATVPDADNEASLIDGLRSKTVAMVALDDDGIERVNCAGVWVGMSTILTAAHCTAPEEAMLGESGYGFATFADLGSHGDHGE